MTIRTLEQIPSNGSSAPSRRPSPTTASSTSLSGDLARRATAPDRRRNGIATRLLREMLQGMRCRALKPLNADSACNSLHAFFTARGIPLASRQYEMIKTL